VGQLSVLHLKTKKDIVQEFRKSELLDAARSVFSRKGFHDATIDDVAREAGVAKGTVYLYFESKQEIYLAALRDGIETLIQEMRAEAAKAGPADVRLKGLIGVKVAFFDKHRDFFHIFHSEFGRAERSMTECKDLYFEQAKIVEHVLIAGVKEGLLRPVNTKKTAFAITDLTRGIAIQRVLGWSKTGLQQEIEFLFGFVWKGISK